MVFVLFVVSRRDTTLGIDNLNGPTLEPTLGILGEFLLTGLCHVLQSRDIFASPRRRCESRMRGRKLKKMLIESEFVSGFSIWGDLFPSLEVASAPILNHIRRPLMKY